MVHCFTFVHLKWYLKTIQSTGAVCSGYMEKTKVSELRENSPVQPSSCLFCPCTRWRPRRNICVFGNWKSVFSARVQTTRDTTSCVKLEGGAMWVFLKAECLIWEMIFDTVKKANWSYICWNSVLHGFGLPFWCTNLRLMEMWAVFCQCPVHFLPKRSSRFYFCSCSFLHLLLNCCFASSSRRLGITDG